MLIINMSRWRELNPRPIPYQGIAIPLSHSGIISTALNIEEGYFTFFLKVIRFNLYPVFAQI